MQNSGRPPLFTAKKQPGFTLIELLVVVLIIGILAAFALPSYRKAVEKARFAEAQITFNALKKALDAYVAETGALPNSLTDLSVQIPVSQNFDIQFWTITTGTTPVIQIALTRKGFTSSFSAGEGSGYQISYFYYLKFPQSNRMSCTGTICSTLLPVSCKNAAYCVFNTGNNWTWQ